jgi:hypothetical protein
MQKLTYSILTEESNKTSHRKITRYFEMNENKSTMCQNARDGINAGFKGQVIPTNTVKERGRGAVVHPIIPAT